MGQGREGDLRQYLCDCDNEGAEVPFRRSWWTYLNAGKDSEERGEMKRKISTYVLQ